MAEKQYAREFFWSDYFVQFLFFRFLGIIFFWNCFILLSFSCSLLRICENVLQVRLEFLDKTRDDFICVVNLFGF